VQVEYKAYAGVVVAHLTRRTELLRCRDCGIAEYRRANAHNLAAGWWGPFSLFLTPFALVANGRSRRDVEALEPPHDALPSRRPRSVGRPVLLRWQALGVLAPVLIAAVAVAVVLGVWHNQSHFRAATSLKVGDCVRYNSTESLNGDSAVEKVGCSATNDGRVNAIVGNHARPHRRLSDCMPDMSGIGRAASTIAGARLLLITKCGRWWLFGRQRASRTHDVGTNRDRFDRLCPAARSLDRKVWAFTVVGTAVGAHTS
jgi:hypothetical protein